MEENVLTLWLHDLMHDTHRYGYMAILVWKNEGESIEDKIHLVYVGKVIMKVGALASLWVGKAGLGNDFPK